MPKRGRKKKKKKWQQPPFLSPRLRLSHNQGLSTTSSPLGTQQNFLTKRNKKSKDKTCNHAKKILSCKEQLACSAQRLCAPNGREEWRLLPFLLLLLSSPFRQNCTFRSPEKQLFLSMAAKCTRKREGGEGRGEGRRGFVS